MIPPTDSGKRQETAQILAAASCVCDGDASRGSNGEEAAHPISAAASGILTSTPSDLRRPRPPNARPPLFSSRIHPRKVACGVDGPFQLCLVAIILPRQTTPIGEKEWQETSRSSSPSAAWASWPPARTRRISNAPGLVLQPAPVSRQLPAPASQPVRLLARRPVRWPTTWQTRSTEQADSGPIGGPAKNGKGAIGAFRAGGPRRCGAAAGGETGTAGRKKRLGEGTCSGNC